MSMVCNWIMYSVDLKCHEMTKKDYAKNVKNHAQFVVQKCQISCYFCWRILVKILRLRKVYEVFHVCHLLYWHFLTFPKYKKNRNIGENVDSNFLPQPPSKGCTKNVLKIGHKAYLLNKIQKHLKGRLNPKFEHRI